MTTQTTGRGGRGGPSSRSGQSSTGQSGQSSRVQGARVHENEDRDYGHGLRAAARKSLGLGLVATATEWALVDWLPHATAVLPATAVGAATISLGALGAAQIARRRGEAIDLIRDSLAELIKARSPITLRRARWRALRLHMLDLQYGPEIIGDIDPALRHEVQQWVNHKLGEPYAAAWDYSRNRVKFTLIPERDRRHDDETPEAEASEQQGAIETRGNEVVKASLGAGASVDVDYDADGSALSFTIDYPTTRRDISAKFRTSVLTEINLKIPGGPWRARWDFENNRVYVERATPLPRMARFPLGDDLQFSRRGQLLCAITEDGPLVWNTDQNTGTPHGLISGATGAGKTVLMRAIALGALRADWRVLAIDPKETDWIGMEDWPGFEAVALVEHQWVLVVDAVYAEMMRRLRLVRRAKRAKRAMPVFEPILLIVDEMIDFYQRLASLWSAMKAADDSLKGTLHPAWIKLLLLGVKARAADIHLLFGSQRPDVEFISGALREQMKFRGTMNALDQAGAKMMWENHASLAIDLPSIKGRALISDSLGRPVEAQVLWVPDPGRVAELGAEDLAFLEAARPAEHDRKPLLVLPPYDDEDDDEDDEDDDEITASMTAVPEQQPRETASVPDVDAVRQAAAAIPAIELEADMRVLLPDADGNETIAKLVDVDIDEEEDVVHLDYIVESSGRGHEQTVGRNDMIPVLFD